MLDIQSILKKRFTNVYVYFNVDNRYLRERVVSWGGLQLIQVYLKNEKLAREAIYESSSQRG